MKGSRERRKMDADHDLLVRLAQDVQWLKKAVFLLFPALVALGGINLFRG